MSVILELVLGNLTEVVGGLVMIAGLFGWGYKRKRDGVKEARQDAKDADFERATELRDRADEVQDDIGLLDDAGRERLRETSPARRD